jgi:ribonuclease P protein component
MLPKSKRLNLRKDYRFVTSGKKFNLSWGTVFLKEIKEEGVFVGIALSKSQFKTAVERNRAKRLVSAAIEQVISGLRSNIKLVIIPRAPVLTKKPEDLLKEILGVKDIFKVD